MRYMEVGHLLGAALPPHLVDMTYLQQVADCYDRCALIRCDLIPSDAVLL